MAKQWYVVHTYSGFEKRVKTLLENKVDELKLSEEIGEVLIPTEDVVELRKGKRHVSTKKTFPGYILVNMEMSTNNWHVVKSVPKVTGFVGGISPVPIPQSDVDIMLNLAKENTVRYANKFIKGDLVEVIEGPFQGFAGIIDEVNPEKERVKVIVTIFGRQTPIELEYLQVKKEKPLKKGKSVSE
jgi:transcriptional antiterminator NusG